MYTVVLVKLWRESLFLYERKGKHGRSQRYRKNSILQKQNQQQNHLTKTEYNKKKHEI